MRFSLKFAVTVIVAGMMVGCSTFGDNTDNAEPQPFPTLKINEAKNNPDPSVIPVEESTISDQYKVLVMNFSTTGSDVSFHQIVFSVKSQASSRIIESATLLFENSEYPARDIRESLQSDRLRFDLARKGEKTVTPKDTVEVALLLRFQPASKYTDDQTIQVAFSKRETVAAQKSTGRKLENHQIKGAAASATHELRESGIVASVAGQSSSIDHQQGKATFRVTLDLTAFDTDVYVRNGVRRWEEIASNLAHGGVNFFIEDGSGNSVTVGEDSASLKSTALLQNSTGVSVYSISESDTEEVTLTVEYHPDQPGLYRLRLDRLQYATSADAADSGDWKTLAVKQAVTDVVSFQ